MVRLDGKRKLVDRIEEIVQSSDVVETIGTVQNLDFLEHHNEKQALDWAEDDLQSRELVEDFAHRTVVRLCATLSTVHVLHVHVQHTVVAVARLGV